MSENQFGNGVDPESFDDFDDIEDQLQPEDTLEQSRVDDSLDEGFIPPDEDRRSRWGETALEEELGEPLDLRLAQELPTCGSRPAAGRRWTAPAGSRASPREIGRAHV